MALWKVTLFCLALLLLGSQAAEPDVGREPFEDALATADGIYEPRAAADAIPVLVPRPPKVIPNRPDEQPPAMRPLEEAEQVPKPVADETSFVHDVNAFPSGPVKFNRTEIFNELPVSSPGRWLHSSVIIGNIMFVFGGISSYSDRLYNDLWVYDYRSSIWGQLQRTYVPPFPSGETRPKDVPTQPDFRNSPPEVSLPQKPIPVLPNAKVPKLRTQYHSSFVELQTEIKQQQLYNGPAMHPSYPHPPTQINNNAPSFRAPPFQQELPAESREQVRQRSHYPRPFGNYAGPHPSPFVPGQGTGEFQPSGNHLLDRIRKQYKTAEQSAPAAPLTRDQEEGLSATTLNQGASQNPAELDWRGLIGLRPERDGLRDWPAMPTDLWAYNLDKKTWQCIVPNSPNNIYPAPAPKTRWLHTAVHMSGRMIVFGGATVEKKIVGDLWLFNPENFSWQEVFPKGPKPLPRQGHCAATTDTEMYIFGGISYGYQPFNDLWTYNAITNTWMEVTKNNPLKMPAPRWLTSCAMVHSGGPIPKDSRFYVFGGVTQEYVPMNDLVVFDASLKAWTKAEVAAGFAPFPRMMHNMVWMGSRLYVVGGMANNIAFEDLHSYDLHEKEWTETLPAGAFPFARGGASAAVLTPPPRTAQARPKYSPFGNRPSARWFPRFKKHWNDNRFMVLFGGVGVTQV